MPANARRTRAEMEGELIVSLLIIHRNTHFDAKCPVSISRFLVQMGRWWIGITMLNTYIQTMRPLTLPMALSLPQNDIQFY